MYLRPRSIFEKFTVAEKSSRVDVDGRIIESFKPTGKILFGVISQNKPRETQSSTGTKHEGTVVIIQRGEEIKANVGDMLAQGDRKFLVTAINCRAEYVIYDAYQRFDLSAS